MAQKKETRFKYKVYDKLDELEEIHYEKIQQVAIRGTPDIIGCYKGLFFAMELKVDDDTSALQSYNLLKYTKARGLAFKVTPTNLDSVIKELASAPRQ